jgi:hypothetical protein
MNRFGSFLLFLTATLLLSACAVPSRVMIPGGLTIAGPAYFEGSAGDQEIMLTGVVAGDPATKLCATVINVGDSTVELRLDLKGGGWFIQTIPKGRTTGKCGPDVWNVTTKCQSNNCKFHWRVDQVSTP